MTKQPEYNCSRQFYGKQQLPNETKEKGHLGELLRSLHSQISSLRNEIGFLREEVKEKNNVIRTLLRRKSCNAKVAVHVKVQNLTTFLEKNEERRDTCISTNSNVIQSDNDCQFKKLAKQKGRVKDIQTDSVTQAHPHETTHLTNTEVTSSNINEMSHVMNKENRLSDKERDKPPPLSQNPNNLQKSKISVFIIGDSLIKKIDGYLLTSSLKHQYLVKTRPFSTAKTIDMYHYIKPAQRDFKPEIFIFHVGTDGPPLNQSPKEISEDIVTLTESMKTENIKIIISSIVCRADSFREKFDEVNFYLKEVCVEKDIAIITHSNISLKRHSNKSK